MDIQFYGANCIVVTTRHARFVIDDNLTSLGTKSVTQPGDICLFTTQHNGAVPPAKMVIDVPGEYEIQGVGIVGIQTRGHMDTDKERNAIMYKITVGDTKLLITGHIYPKLSEAKLENIGLVDIMMVPVGGTGYTMDPTGALRIVKQVEPKIFVPTHYADAALDYEVSQQSLDDAIKVIGMEPKDRVKKLQYKPSELTDTTQLVILEKN